VNKAIVINPSKCSGCRSCEVVCSMVKEGEAGIFKSRIKTLRYPDDNFYLPRVCFHCKRPYCISGCPTEAISKDGRSGVVNIDAEKCTGCGVCIESCPFGAIFMVNSVAVKCDLCGGNPMCVKYCEPAAITYGEPIESAVENRMFVALMKKLGVI
jgi:carbon-monoxide dehydrogenase iron sulfur subunit